MSFRVLCIGDVFENIEGRLDDDISLHSAGGAFEALDLLRSQAFDALLARIPIPGCSTPEILLEEIQRLSRSVRVILCDRTAGVERTVELVKRGVFDVVDEERLVRALAQCAAARRETVARRAASEPWRRTLIGSSPAMERVAEMIRLIANRRCTVLVTGETGTGKEVVARAIHQASNRATHPLVAVNCSALPETLLEAELFGHIKGAFTGAIASRMGRFEQANRGTLFLDEIGDMPLSLQAKLLRVLQEREFERLGSSETIRIDVRVIAATNTNLMERMREGKFREDLFYRLNVAPIHLPPLRERPEDLPLLVEYFVERACREEGIARKEVSQRLLDRLSGHDWPGNVRQLQNAVEMAVALSGERAELTGGDFPLPSRITAPSRPAPDNLRPFIAVPDHGLDFEETVGRIEKNLLEQALNKTNGNKKAAAEMLRLKRTTLAAKLKTLSAVAAAG